jgi:hypothetical protein
MGYADRRVRRREQPVKPSFIARDGVDRVVPRNETLWEVNLCDADFLPFSR